MILLQKLGEIGILALARENVDIGMTNELEAGVAVVILLIKVTAPDAATIALAALVTVESWTAC